MLQDYKFFTRYYNVLENDKKQAKNEGMITLSVDLLLFDIPRLKKDRIIVNGKLLDTPENITETIETIVLNCFKNNHLFTIETVIKRLSHIDRTQWQNTMLTNLYSYCENLDAGLSYDESRGLNHIYYKNNKYQFVDQHIFIDVIESIQKELLSYMNSHFNMLRVGKYIAL